MAVLFGLVAGLFAGRLVWILLRHTLAQPLFLRENFRGVPVPTACGIVLPLAAILVEGGRSVLGAAAVAGAAIALLPEDLRERAMLGDTGANVMGGALGLGVVAACSPGVRIGALVVVAALNVLSELVSFSRVIEAVPPLRAADRA